MRERERERERKSSLCILLKFSGWLSEPL